MIIANETYREYGSKGKYHKVSKPNIYSTIDWTFLCQPTQKLLFNDLEVAYYGSSVDNTCKSCVAVIKKYIQELKEKHLIKEK